MSVVLLLGLFITTGVLAAVCEPDARGHTFRWRDADYVEQ